MYAVITTGGKQERVEVGTRVDVERLGAPEGETVRLAPVLIVDGDSVLAEPAELAGTSVEARVVGSAKGPKVRGFTYKAKGRARRRFGHRQQYTTIEVTAIGAKPAPRKRRAATAETAESE
ncbi:MAG: 50S ribosomal protein L21 [Acidimicrobiales bacterium]